MAPFHLKKRALCVCVCVCVCVCECMLNQIMVVYKAKVGKLWPFG